MLSEPKIVASCKVVDVSKLFVSEFNARQQDEQSTTGEAFTWLCNSIKSEGLIEPIIVRPVGGEYEIVAGTRRFAALKHIGAKQAPVVVREMTDNDVRVASLVENIHREDLTEDEKEYTLKQIYLTQWDSWKPTDFPIKIRGKVKDTFLTKEYEEVDFDNDENKILLAKSYCSRLHNEETGATNLSKVKGSKYASKEQEVFPTKAFRILAARVGYAASTQINILSARGAISSDTDFVMELPQTRKEQIEEAERERQRKLDAKEKQRLARRLLNAEKSKRKAPKKPKTKDEKAKAIIDTFMKEIAREDIKKEQKKKEQQFPAPRSKFPKDPETERSARRTREEILEHSHKLFKLLTGQEMQGIDPTTYESFARNTLATQTMNQLVTFVSGSKEIAAQQRIIIPLNVALQRYRDFLYNAVESQKRKEDIGGR